MPLFRDQAVVLRCHKLGEADRIITMLSRNHGKVRAVAKGVRRTSSSFGSRLEPLNYVDVLCHTGRSLAIITQAELVAGYGQVLAHDYPRWTAGQAMAETADKLTDEEGQPTMQQFWLLLGGLRSLAESDRDLSLVLDAYLLRSMSVAGWAPSFEACVRCGSLGPHRAFNIAAGGSLCDHCRVPGSAAPSPSALELMSALLTGDWPAAESSAVRARREVSGLVAAYSQWHLDRKLRALPLVDRTK